MLFPSTVQLEGLKQTWCFREIWNKYMCSTQSSCMYGMEEIFILRRIKKTTWFFTIVQLKDLE